MRITKTFFICVILLFSVSFNVYGQANRFCVVCKQNKPVSAFSGESKTCKVCVNNAEMKAAVESIERNKRLSSCGTFSEGLASIKGGNGKYGYIDKSGKLVISS